MKQYEARCPICKREIGTGSGRIATHNKPNSFDICEGSRRYFEVCGAPGMVAGENCIWPKGHAGTAHLPMPKRRS